MWPTILRATLAFAGPLLAQDLPVRLQEPTTTQERAQRSQTAVEHAELGEAMAGGPAPTYADVLRHPDDVGLNYRYALSQVRAGNLRSAAATLERVLRVQPELPKVRLVYAVVLFRLDDLDEAERELRILDRERMPASLRAELEAYRRQIRRRRRSAHPSVLLGAGFDLDDNRNAAPASGRRLLFDTPVVLDENSTRKGDVAATMLGDLGLTYDLGYQEGHQVFVDYTYFRAEQGSQRVLNLQNHAADLGAKLRLSWLDVTPSVEFDHLLLTQTTYLRSRGARLRLERQATPRLGVFLESAYSRQVYNRTLVVPNGDDRTGDHLEGTAGGSWVLTPTMSLLLGYTHVEQGAAASFDAYRRESLTAAHTWLLGRGQFLLSTLIVNFDQYRAPELVVSQTSRRDQTYRARVGYGLPLRLLAPALRDLIFTLSYEYYQAVSTLPNYAYSNNRLSGLWTYKWEP